MNSLRLVDEARDAGANDTAREAQTIVRRALVLIGVLFGGVGLWSSLATLHGAVVAPGVTRTEVTTQAVQPAEGGVVRRIFIAEGAHVTAGDPIVELDSAEAHATHASVRDQLDAALARHARLTAEIRGHSSIAFPRPLQERAREAGVAALVRSESELFHARRHLIAEQAAKLRDQAHAIEAQIRSNDEQVAAAQKSLGYLKQQEEMNVALHEQRFVSSARLLDARRSAAEKEEKRFEFEALGAAARQRLADVEMRLSGLRAAQLAEATKEIVEMEARILALQERLKPVSDALERRIVRAPATGTVNLLRANTAGGVVAARETIAEIVPADTLLMTEVRVNPADIEEVHTGQEAEIELSGVNRRSVPLLRGKVTFVSPEAHSDPATPSLRYFLVRAALTDTLPDRVTLTPGMPVTVYIRTRSRSPLELWLDPLLGGFRKALRES